MVDFDKLLGGKRPPKEIDPVLIFDKLDKQSGKEYLRDPPQKSVLRDWYDNHRTERDVIIKLHTGQGKTLVGLLMLQSGLNQGIGPAVYLCPNTYLVGQTVKQAKQFRIKTVEFPNNKGKVEIPSEFSNSEAILVTTCNKLFNGKSVFGVRGSRDAVEIGNLVMDDAHKCLDIIRQSFTISVERYVKGTESEPNPLYLELWELFKDSLKEQAPGTFLELAKGEFGDKVIMPVPFWVWFERQDQVLEILMKHRHDEEVRFVWDLVKNDIANAWCFFSGTKLEITPRVVQVDLIPSFAMAKRRIFLSATLTEDSFLVRDLGINPDSVRNPISKGDVSYSGERLILLPHKLLPEISREQVIEWVTLTAKTRKSFGIFALVPSNQVASSWKSKGAIETNVANLERAIGDLEKDVLLDQSEKVVVLLNEYDGVDLPDDLCRVLCLDSSPSYSSLLDTYMSRVRPDSDVIRRKLAQRIEQGMGRGIRGISDWCAVVVAGNDLTSYLSDKQKRKYLSPETQTQLEIAEELLESLKGEKKLRDGMSKLLDQCLDRFDGWKDYYKDRMSKVTKAGFDEKHLRLSRLEREAEAQFRRGDFPQACKTIQSILDDIPTENAQETGWYLQLKAMYSYPDSKENAMKCQIAAYSDNLSLFRPPEGVRYRKIRTTAERANNIRAWAGKYEGINSILVDLKEIIGRVRFRTISSDDFEKGIEELGIVLGFVTQRPDKTEKGGPDDLWNLRGNEYWIIECKSNVSKNKTVISKTEIEQLQGSLSWFKTVYKGEGSGVPIIVHPATRLASDAYMADPFWVMNEEKLEKLKSNLYEFYRSFDKPFDRLSNEYINDQLSKFKLNTDILASQYLVRGLK